jgi:hypothetical protein
MKRDAAHSAPSQSHGSRTLALWLGTAETLAGCGLLYDGVRHGLLANDGTAIAGGTVSILIALFAFVIPGIFLCLRRPLSWAPQLLLAIILTWYLAAGLFSGILPR